MLLLIDTRPERPRREPPNVPWRVWFNTSVKNCAELPAKMPGVTAPDSTSIRTESWSEGDSSRKPLPRDACA